MSARGLAIDEAAWASPWRHRRVRDKGLLSLGLLTCALALPPVPATIIVAGAAWAVLAGPAGVPVRVLTRCLRAPAAFIAIGGLTLLVTIGGPGRLIGVDAASATAAGVTVLHAGSATLAAFILAATTPVIDLLTSLRRLRIPDPLIDISEVMYRLVFVLLESARTVTEAQTARLGYASRSAALRSASGAIGAMLLRSLQRASRLENGLIARGYTEGLRTLAPPRQGSVRFVALTLALLAALVAISAFVAWQWPSPWTSFRWAS